MRLPRFSPQLLFALTVALLVPSAKAQESSVNSSGSSSALSSAQTQSNLRRDVEFLSGLPSRVPGTAGNAAAAAYVKKRFGEIGLEQVRSDSYLVTAPVTREASLSLGGRALQIHPIYPNHVVASTTPPAGLTGPIVYAGMGRPSDFNGQKVEGSIVALDFNSGMSWITAADLGAKAIIFLENSAADRGQAERKFAMLPVEVPRFYAPEVTANAIRGAANASATVKSLVTWEKVPVDNVLGFLKGRNAPAADKPNTLVVNAYYDSMSVVPDLAPGAEAAGNMAAMLELAARLKRNPPAYNVLFVANGAHHMALAGTRNFIAKHVIDGDGTADDAKKAEMASYRAFINLDLTSRTETVGLFAKSWFYNQMTVGSENILLNQFSNLAKNLGRYVEEQAKRTNTPVEEIFVDGVTGKDGRTWRSFLPSLVALDSEVATMAALPGISFATANDVRLLQDTPFDTADKISYENLSEQIGTTENLFRRTVTEISQGDSKGTPVIPAPATLSNNFGFFVARGIYRDVEKATSFLPDTPLPDSQLDPKLYEGVQAVGAVVTDRMGSPLEQKSYAGVRGVMIERATYSDAAPGASRVAQFVFTGPRVGDPKGGGTPNYEFEAFSINRNGHMIFAPDRGSERQRFSPMFNKVAGSLLYKDQKLRQYEINASLICFRSRASTIFDTLDQRYYTVLREMSVLDARTDAAPVEYGFIRPAIGPGSAEIEPIAIVFAKRNERYKLIMAAGLLGKRLVLLQTSEVVNGEKVLSYEGRGFKVEGARTAEQIRIEKENIAKEQGIDVKDVQLEIDPNEGLAPNRITKIAYQTATDLWTLNQQRIRLLKGFGINNERVDLLHAAAGCATKDGKPDCPTEAVTRPNGGSLLLASQALENQRYDTFYREARRAFGLESRAYPDVEATSQDVLKGIIFYLALLLPFAFFVERMLFGFPDIRKQIIGTSLVFLGVFGAIRFVHPAFELALTPFIILLAFVILALTVVVTAFLQSKFEQEIKRMKQGVHYADMGRLSALGAALGLGIANMRRRPTRTALTCVTLVLLTFTVLSFTSVTANIANFARPYGDGRTPPYQGFLIRQPDWSAMPEVAVASLRNEVVAQGLPEPALRAWYLSRDQGEALQLRVANANQPSQFFYAPALLGMTPQELAIGSPVAKQENLIAGRWFRDGDTDVCILPRDVLLSDAQRASERRAAQGDDETAQNAAPTTQLGPPLGLTVENAIGSSIQIAGKTLEVIGIFDDRKWYGPQATNNLRDLDNEEFSPVDYGSDQSRQNAQTNSQAQQSGDEVQVQRYEHMRANALLILPYQTAINMGATTRSMAVGIEDAAKAQAQLEDMMQRAALGIFGATPDQSGKLVSKLYSSVEATSYEGFASLAVPIIIAALIIANTMLGSVYERTREIGIYSSIGLAPVHIGALFIAEAAVYAVLGSISGYLIAQIVAKIITATNALPGITLNYSSSSAVLSTLIVMATVFLSTIYPASAASKISNPEGKKSNLGEPVGDLWRLQFPFTVSGLQSLGMAQFLADFFQSHTDTSVGKFYTDRVHFEALMLREAVEVLNDGVSPEVPVTETSAKVKPPKKSKNGGPPPPENSAPARNGFLKLEEIAAEPESEVYRLAMRTWLAPFDMGVSQDTDIILLPSNEPGLYELQLRLLRKSGEIAAWKRVNREFMTELRKQLLVWRTVKPEDQQEYILRGRAHINGQRVPEEEPGAVVV